LDVFPDIFRFSASVFPSQNDDVITSPYNSVLALFELMKHADCTLPIDNQALINIVNEAEVLKTKLKDNRTEEPLGNKVQ
jgi:tubulin epsilon